MITFFEVLAWMVVANLAVTLVTFFNSQMNRWFVALNTTGNAFIERLEAAETRLTREEASAPKVIPKPRRKAPSTLSKILKVSAKQLKETETSAR